MCEALLGVMKDSVMQMRVLHNETKYFLLSNREFYSYKLPKIPNGRVKKESYVVEGFREQMRFLSSRASKKKARLRGEQ